MLIAGCNNAKVGAELHDLVRASFTMHGLVSGVAVRVDLESVQEGGRVLRQPFQNWVVGWNPCVNAGFDGGFKSPELILGGLDSAFGPAIGW